MQREVFSLNIRSRILFYNQLYACIKIVFLVAGGDSDTKLEFLGSAKQ